MNASLLFFLLSLKCGKMWVYDEILGWKNAKNIRCHVESILGFPEFYVQTNSEGFRDNDDWKNLDGKKKILILGDSVCFGFGLEFQKTAGQIIEKLLGEKFKTLNMSVVGYSTDQETLLLEKEGVKYKPDYVVYCVWVNDIAGILDSMPLENGRGKPVFHLKDGKLEIKNVPVKNISLFPKRYLEMFELLYGRHAGEFYEKKEEPGTLMRIKIALDLILRKIEAKLPLHTKIINETVSLFEAIIRYGKSRCENCKLIVVLIPDYLQAKGLNPFAEKIYNIIKKEIKFADVIKIELPEDHFFPQNYHPNEKGHEKIAQIISETIRKLESNSKDSK